MRHHIVMRGPSVAKRARRILLREHSIARREVGHMAKQRSCRLTIWQSLGKFTPPHAQGPCGDYYRKNGQPDKNSMRSFPDFLPVLETENIVSKIIQFDLFEFLVLIFDMESASQTSQRYIDQLLTGHVTSTSRFWNRSLRNRV